MSGASQAASSLASFSTVQLNITSASGCNFTTGTQSGATGNVTGTVATGADISITAGSLSISISFVKFGSAKVAFTSFSFSDNVNSGSGSGSGFATGNQSNVLGFNVQGSGSGSPGCIFAFTALGGDQVASSSSSTSTSTSSSTATSSATTTAPSTTVTTQNPLAETPGSKQTQSDNARAALSNGPFADVVSFLGTLFGSGSGLARNDANGLRLGRNHVGFVARGLSAGESGIPFGVWANLGYTHSENDFASTAFDLNRVHATIGVDTSVTDNVIVGVALGAEDTGSDTVFNSGEQDTSGVSIIPYVAASFGERFSGDLAFGYSNLDIDQFRLAGATRVTSTLDAERWFFAGNVNYVREYGDWHVTTRVGALWARDEQDGFTESDGTANAKQSFRLGRFQLGLELAKTLGAFEPFAGVTLNHTFSQTDQTFPAGVADPGEDLNDGVGRAGVRYFGPGGASGILEFSTLLGRDNVDEFGLTATFRAEFD